VTDQPRTDPKDTEDTERSRGRLDPDPIASSDRERAPETERSATDAGRSQDPEARDREDPDRRDREDQEGPNRGDTDRRDRQSDRRDREVGRSNLVGTDERAELRERWDVIQTSFIDDPRAATSEADALLRDTMERLIARWEQELSDVRHNWDTDEDRSTEDLRVTMRRYRDTLERLLSA
jgi:hypothetical protein